MALIIAAASGALILVYWGTVWVQVPIQIEFDPRSPTEIKTAYNKSVKIKSRRLSITLLGSVIAAIMVSFALIVASVSKPVKRDFSDIRASIETIDGKSMVSITAWVGETKKVSLTVTPVSGKEKSGKNITNVVLPTKEGLLQTSIDLQTVTFKTVLLNLQWVDKSDNQITITKTISPN